MKIEKYFKESKENITKFGVYTIEHINKPNIYYVGSTGLNGTGISKGFYLRWRLHIYYLEKNIHHNIKLQNVVNKYGLDGIRFKIVEITSNNKEELLNKEQNWIDKLDILKNGYNIYPFARSCKGRKGIANHVKAVNQFDINGNIINSFKSAREAAQNTKSNYKKISACCNGIINSSNGFIWRFINDSFNKYKIKIQCKNYNVLQLDYEGNIINKWNCISDINKKLNISLGNLSSCINGNRYSAGGYIWKKGD